MQQGGKSKESKILRTVRFSVFYFRAVLMEVTRKFTHHSHSYLLHS